MNYHLLDTLVCPQCIADLDIDVMQTKAHAVNTSSTTPCRLVCKRFNCLPLHEINSEKECYECSNIDIVEGILTCTACKATYPVINGIPRMQPPQLRSILFEHYSDFFNKYESLLPDWKIPDKTLSGQDKWKEKTLRSFGYEWTTFSNMLEEYSRAYWEYFNGKTPDFFKDKIVLDAGCGTGRHAHFTSDHCRELIGVDLSMAVEVARKNTLHNSNVNIVQADIYTLPFRENTFDFVYSIGVIHHLPRPYDAFRNLCKYVKNGGAIRTYLYKTMDDEPWHKRFLILFHHAIRSITTKFPLRFVMTLSFIAGVLFTIAFVWPYKIIRKIPGLNGFAEHIPFKVYANYPFRVIFNDQFDRFATPIENRYTKEEVLDWYNKNHLENISISKYYGWLTEGTKPK